MDRELLQRVSAGDLEAREQVWDYLTNRLGVFFLEELHDSELATELAQHTIVAVLEFTEEQLPEHPGELWALVQSFAENRLKRYLTQLGRDHKNANKLTHHGRHLRLILPASMERDYAEGEQLELLQSLLKQLPPQLQRCLELRASGHTLAEVARKMGWSQSTTARRYQTTKRRLRRHYERARRTRPKFRSPPQTAS